MPPYSAAQMPQKVVRNGLNVLEGRGRASPRARGVPKRPTRGRLSTRWAPGHWLAALASAGLRPVARRAACASRPEHRSRWLAGPAGDTRAVRRAGRLCPALSPPPPALSEPEPSLTRWGRIGRAC